MIPKERLKNMADMDETAIEISKRLGVRWRRPSDGHLRQKVKLRQQIIPGVGENGFAARVPAGR